ncbi:hypothetical protein B0H10DRAFT_2211512 [Mycena sp. CBHHK59/15]|nr:hypothetical protein B0H10DRAFT_2211512 [Mycena sp. CBHHK59/15]
MFSSISSFLPSALHSSSPQKADQIRADDDDDDDEPGNKSDVNADETGVLKKKKDKSANEVIPRFSAALAAAAHCLDCAKHEPTDAVDRWREAPTSKRVLKHLPISFSRSAMTCHWLGRRPALW